MVDVCPWVYVFISIHMSFETLASVWSHGFCHQVFGDAPERHFSLHPKKHPDRSTAAQPAAPGVERQTRALTLR